MTLQNGYLLRERYRILDILGQGGMGAVYRALDENLDVEVAVKENAFLSDEHTRQFQREAKILASLRHPNLPRVFDYFVIEEQGQYLVMDYIKGSDLRQWMSQEGELSEAEAVRIGLSICEALIYLHSRVPPINHRDIKPGNIKITPEGEVILVDFGLVKIQNEKELTTTAARAMTPGYSPPEQYGETPTDHRSDLFSLGATLYAALAGYLPEDSLSRTTGKAALTPLRSYNHQVSKKTADIIEKALELRFEDRWQSAQQLKNALLAAYEDIPLNERISERLAPFNQGDNEGGMSDPLNQYQAGLFKKSAANPDKKGYDPGWVIFGFAIFVLVISLGISIFWPRGLSRLIQWRQNSTSTATSVWATNTQAQSNPPSPVNTSTSGSNLKTATPIEVSVLNTLTPGVVSELPSSIPSVLSESQSTNTSSSAVNNTVGTIAFVSERSGKPQIWIKDIQNERLVQLTDLDDGACQPDWSPDGMRVVFTSPCSNQRLAYSNASLFIIDIENEEIQTLPPSLEGDFDPAWSPDGDWIAFTRLINDRTQIMKINLNDLEIVQLSVGEYSDSNPAWSPDGDQIAFVRIRGVRQIWLMDADGGNPVQFSYSGKISNFNPAWYPQQDLILFSQELGPESPSKQILGMRLKDLGTPEEKPIMTGTYNNYIPLMDHLDVSPDGEWLVFDFWYHNVLSDIYIMNFPASNLQQVTHHPAKDYDPVWRP